VLNAAAGELRVRTTLFDEFTKDGRVSYAFRLVFQSYEKTLTDAEVNTIMDRITAAVSERRWEVR
jgi:phenylalanyl-tRNA synthetase beta chain